MNKHDVLTGIAIAIVACFTIVFGDVIVACWTIAALVVVGLSEHRRHTRRESGMAISDIKIHDDGAGLVATVEKGAVYRKVPTEDVKPSSSPDFVWVRVRWEERQ